MIDISYDGDPLILIALLTIVLMSVTTIPVKLAASFVGAGRTSLKASALAVVTVTFLAWLTYTLMDESFEGVLLACISVVFGYKLILDTPFFSAVSLAIITIGLQFVFLIAWGSFMGHVTA